MAQMQNAQSVALQLEKVRDKLPLLYERDDILLTMIQQRGDVERVSSRNMRLPLQIRAGGKAGLVNMDGGDLGRGSGTIYDVAQVHRYFSGTRWRSRSWSSTRRMRRRRQLRIRPSAK
ncbi:MAG: hypothetical protein WA673_15425 [Candidatus Acidiferrales bacterium]